MLSYVKEKSQKLGKKKSDDYTVKVEDGVVKIDASNCDKFVYIDAYEPQFFDYSRGKVWGIVDRCRKIYIKKNPNIADQVFVLNYARYQGEETPEPTVEPTEAPAAEPTTDPANVQSANAAAAPADDPSDGDGGNTVAMPEEGSETPTEAPTEAPATESETEEKVSLLGLPTEVHAAEHTYAYDVANSKKVEVQLARVWFADDNWQPIQLNENSASAVEDFSQRVIYNLPYANKVWANQTIGTILAPEADSKFGGNDDNDQSNRANCSGWFVTKRIESNCGEWHFYRTPPSTPTPTPTATPTPTPTPVVTESPTPTPVVTESPTPTPVVTESPTPTPVVTESPTPTPVVTESPTPTPVITTQPPVTTPPVVTPPVTTPPVVYYTMTPPPTPSETPTTVVEEEVPLAPFVPDEPSDTTTIVEDVPLAATVPETGDTMNPMVPIAGMGLSLLAIVGVVVIRKKKLIK